MRAALFPPRRSAARAARALLAALLSLILVAQPAMAQQVLRDAETEALFDDISRPIIAAAGLEPKNVHIVLLQDPEINAFVAGGQTVYIQSGLIDAADSANQVQGVIAHELGHVVGGHVITNGEGAKAATGITILSMLLGVAAMAAGAGSAGMGILMAGQQAAEGKYLAFTRNQEASADAASVRFLNGAHISGKGNVEFFGKLRKEEYRLTPSYTDVDPFSQSHPMTADREATLRIDFQKSPWWNTPSDPALEARFQRVKAKLAGYVDDPKVTFARYPEQDQSIPALYARAYAWHKAAYPDKAVAEVDKLVAKAPHDPYFLELKGQVLLESGQPAAAVPVLREAVARARNAPLIATTLGHALVATEDPTNFAEARTVLRTAVARDEENPFAWYNLGVIYAADGDDSHAALATAERYSLEGNPRLALGSADMAMKGIAEGTPDYIRAQDIALTARTAIDDAKKKKH